MLIWPSIKTAIIECYRYVMIKYIVNIMQVNNINNNNNDNKYHVMRHKGYCVSINENTTDFWSGPTKKLCYE